MEFPEWVINQLTILGEAFGERWTEERQEIYCTSLLDIPQERLRVAFKRACSELKWFPKIAELRELAGFLPGSANDGRPGPEEAWARMPKGDRMEEETIVWCDEERDAYGACRPLLREGDHIGARMAFKERYEREVSNARAQRRNVHWAISTGFDMESRLTTLADAIKQKRISTVGALPFVPMERRNDFAQMLPPGETRGVLVAGVQAPPSLPGLPGVLAQLRMQDALPEGLAHEARPSYSGAGEMSPEELGRRREELKAQSEFLSRSRKKSKLHS